jgi:hypothetical protein
MTFIYGCQAAPVASRSGILSMRSSGLWAYFGLESARGDMVVVCYEEAESVQECFAKGSVPWYL